jgi:hypothetical protein
MASQGSVPRRRVAGERRREQRSPARRGPLARVAQSLRKRALWAVVAAVAVIGGVFHEGITTAVRHYIDPDEVADAALRDKPIQIRAADAGNSGSEWWAFAQPTLLAPGEISALDGTGGDPQGAFERIARAHGGTRLGAMDLRVTLVGRRAESVHLRNIRIKFLKRTGFLVGGLLCRPGAGGGDVERVDFNLDSSADPIPRTPEGEEYFLRRQVTLAEREEVGMTVRIVDLKGGYAEFVLLYDVEYGSRRATVVAGNEGSPFKITGIASGSSSHPYTAYKTLYTSDVGLPTTVADPTNYSGGSCPSRG